MSRKYAPNQACLAPAAQTAGVVLNALHIALRAGANRQLGSVTPVTSRA